MRSELLSTLGGARLESRPHTVDRTVVVLRVPASFGVRRADVAGDFSAWSPLPMVRDRSGAFTLRVGLARGRRWRYRFLLDEERWIVDPGADDVEQLAGGGVASILHT